MPNHASDSRIRILFICHDGTMYGSQQSLKLLVENLPAERYRIYVSFSKGGALQDYFETLPDLTVLTHQRIQWVKHSQRNAIQRVGDILAGILNLPRAFRLASMLKNHQIQIAHTNSIVSIEAALAARIAGVKHVWHIREMFVDYNPRFCLVLGIPVSRWIIDRLAHQVICISGYVASQFAQEKQRNPAKYPILLNAVVLPKVQAKPPATALMEPLNLLYLGRMSDGKRFQDIIDALAILKQESSNSIFSFKLDAYGHFIDPNFEAEMTQKINDHGLNPFVRLHSYTDNIDPCFTNINALMMPSSTEAFGRTMLDAMGRGIPVIVARTGAPLEVVQEGVTGFFHNPNDPRDVARCLREVFENRINLDRMGQAARRDVETRFSIGSQIQILNSIYQSL